MFASKLYDVEHALLLMADGFVLMPATALYDKKALRPYAEIAARCHVYMIGLVPRAELADAVLEGGTLTLTYSVLGAPREARWPVEPGTTLERNHDKLTLVLPDGRRSFPDATDVVKALNREQPVMNFDVQYVGQAYGKGGSRKALDRLMKHEKLQQIALEAPAGFKVEVLLLEVRPAPSMVTMFNPVARDRSGGAARIAAGLDKLFGTDGPERITLYEAALIRHFRPRYNKEFKDSFPSTNMKLLNDCYDKDFSAVVAEIGLEGFPYGFLSGDVPLASHVIARHDLHDDPARRVFFATG